MLLKHPDTDSMYEVEVMLGETDESHIIRTIEYWDNEKRRWPQRRHSAVLVAESITRRFFNVIQLLSQGVPIIAIQANLIEANGEKALVFTKVLDLYEEPEEPGGDIEEPPVTEAYWKENAVWTLETAKEFAGLVKPVLGNVTSNFTNQYIGLRVNQNNYFWFNKRRSDKSRLGFRIDNERMDKITTLLDDAELPFTKQIKRLLVTTNKEGFLANAETFRKIAILVKNYWEG